MQKYAIAGGNIDMGSWPSPQPALSHYSFARTTTQSLDDKNQKNRLLLIRELYPVFQKQHKQLVRFLLLQEIFLAQAAGYFTPGLNVTSFMLYTIMDITDVPLLYDAKFNTGFDASFSLDIELVFGLDKDVTKKFYQRKKQSSCEVEIVSAIQTYEHRPYKTRSEHFAFYYERRINSYLDDITDYA